MSETQIDSEASAGSANMQTRSEKASVSTVHSYASAGVEEREGSVPIWLWVVVAVLLMWGFYYLIAYWDAPIGPT